MRKLYSLDTVELKHEVRSAKGTGTVKARLIYDAPCSCGCRTPGGWTLDYANLRQPDGEYLTIEAEDFIKRFGFGALADLEQHAADYARELSEPDPDRERD